MAVKSLASFKGDTLYRTVANNAQQIGSKFFASVPVELFCIDESYQRTDTRDMRKIAQLAKKWDDNKMTPLLVTAHPDESKFCIVDGYGRYKGNSLRDESVRKTELECAIIFDVPEDIEERRKFEAKLFVAQMDEVESLKPYQKHKAAILLGDPIAIAVQEACDKFDLKWTHKTGQRGKKILGSYTDAYRIVGRNGKEALEFIFDTIHKLHWDTEKNGYSRCVMYGMRKVYECSKVNDKAQKKIVEALRGTTPENLRAFAVSKYPMRNHQAATVMYVEDLLGMK